MKRAKSAYRGRWPGERAGFTPAETDSAAPADESPERPSRSARKRDAEALQRLGVRLAQLRPAQLQQLALPDELLQAVLEAQRLRGHRARARQHQYIGRLMRSVDPAPIERALAASLARPPRA